MTPALDPEGAHFAALVGSAMPWTVKGAQLAAGPACARTSTGPLCGECGSPVG